MELGKAHRRNSDPTPAEQAAQQKPLNLILEDFAEVLSDLGFDCGTDREWTQYIETAKRVIQTAEECRPQAESVTDPDLRKRILVALAALLRHVRSAAQQDNPTLVPTATYLDGKGFQITHKWPSFQPAFAKARDELHGPLLRLADEVAALTPNPAPEPDGVYPPNRVRIGGNECSTLSALECRIVGYMMGKQSAPKREVERACWPAKTATDQAIRQRLNNINQKFMADNIHTRFAYHKSFIVKA